MSREIEERIGSVAARQHGVATHRQLLEAGLSASGIARRERSGRLRRLHRGVYLAMAFPLPQTRAMAAVLASGPDALLSHLDAGELWRMCFGAAPADVVHVSGAAHHPARPGIVAHRVRLDDADRAVKDGIPVTTPARTLLDAATLRSGRKLEQMVARAQREGLVSEEALSSLLARSTGHKGVRALREVLEAPGGPVLTRSAAEARFLALVREARLPPPECNVAVGPHELDFFWRRRRLAVEVDGFRYHSSRASFESDRARDAELLASGITVMRLTWRQLEEPLATIALLARALERPGLPG